MSKVSKTDSKARYTIKGYMVSKKEFTNDNGGYTVGEVVETAVLDAEIASRTKVKNLDMYRRALAKTIGELHNIPAENLIVDITYDETI